MAKSREFAAPPGTVEIWIQRRLARLKLCLENALASDRRFASAGAAAIVAPMDISAIDAPLRLHSTAIRPEWIDYNGHMNVAYYVLAFDHATDAFFDFLGLTDAYRRDNNASTFALEAHVNYLRELHEGDAVRIETQLLDHDHRRMHFFHSMIHDSEGHLAATSEWINTHVDMTTRRSADFFAPVEERLAAVLKAHAHLDPPDNKGRVIGIRRRKRNS